MWTRQHKKRNTGVLIVPALAIAFLSYFGFHALHGDFGIYSSYRLVDRAEQLQTRLAMLRSERTHLESRVLLLHDGTIEKDMLDEQARKGLNLSKPGEVTIMLTGDNAN